MGSVLYIAAAPIMILNFFAGAHGAPPACQRPSHPAFRAPLNDRLAVL